MTEAASTVDSPGGRVAVVMSAEANRPMAVKLPVADLRERSRSAICTASAVSTSLPTTLSVDQGDQALRPRAPGLEVVSGSRLSRTTEAMARMARAWLRLARVV